MMQYGASALSHAELLAILLRTGTRQESAVHIAQRRWGSRRHPALVDLSIEEITQIKGIGTAKAVQLKAGIELGRRLAASRHVEPVIIRSPHDAAELLSEQMRYLQKEHFVCVFLNTKNHVIAQETLSMEALMLPSFIPARCSERPSNASASLVCAHNHLAEIRRPARKTYR